MSARLGFGGTVVALTALQVLVSSSEATGRVSGALSGVGKVLRQMSDPARPAIPDLRDKTSSSAPAAPSATPSAAPLTAKAPAAAATYTPPARPAPLPVPTPSSRLYVSA